jgi:tRNA nucleotidyltransferase (CCA-adding enzyme)
MIVRNDIPKEVQYVADTLENGGFEAYLVGGCVRDLLIGKQPKDWDITTNAHPTDIESLFTETFVNNEYGTVGVVNEETEDPTLKVVQVTPYRTESGYSDARRPDSVEFGVSLEEDLKRRDFTVNAIAYRLKDAKIVDLYGGEEDIAKKRLRAVGEATERFAEDALRMMRAVRLAVRLEFTIESETMNAIAQNASNLGRISKERIRDEFVKILESKQPMQGIIFLEKLGLLQYVAPDLLRGIGIDQNQAHAFDVYEHLLRTMQHAADKDWGFDVRIAGLFHDVSKPETRRWSKEKNDWTFHGHEVVGAKVTKKALQDLKFPKETIDKVVKLVRWHMFFSDPAQISLSAPSQTWDQNIFGNSSSFAVVTVSVLGDLRNSHLDSANIPPWWKKHFVTLSRSRCSKLTVHVLWNSAAKSQGRSSGTPSMHFSKKSSMTHRRTHLNTWKRGQSSS